MIAVGQEAPNFDLTSTEDVVLQLRDEVPRTAVVLYLTADPAAPEARRDLAALAARHDALAELRAKVLVVSPAPLAALKQAQREQKLPFPLLHDDRNLAAAYGFVAAAAAEGQPAAPPAPGLFAVGRDQKVSYAAQPAGDVAAALAAVEALLRAQGRPTARYPKGIVNRLIDRWVN